MKTWKSFVKRNIEWMILSAVLFFLHVLYLFLIGRTGDDLIYAGILDLPITGSVTPSKILIPVRIKEITTTDSPAIPFA